MRDIEELIDEKELARRTGISASTWSKRGLTGDTPPYIKIGKSCRYEWAKAREWLLQQERRSTSDTGSGAA